MTLSKVRIEMARDAEFPEGSSRHGYEFVAPLDKKHHIDAKSWQANREKCRVKRFWEDDPDEIGHLVRKPGGSWAFHYDIHGDIDDDETGYRFGDHALVPGEYISIREHGEDLRTFRIVSVLPLDQPHR
jgi:hypothetical protein